MYFYAIEVYIILGKAFISVGSEGACGNVAKRASRMIRVWEQNTITSISIFISHKR